MRNEKKLDIKVVKNTGAAAVHGGWRARVLSNGVVGFDEVLEEVVEQGATGLRPELLKMYLELTMNTIIRRCREDGRARRFGDYFLVQPQVRGRFETHGEPFDPQKHTFALALRPLKMMREAFRDSQSEVTVRNRDAGPLVVMRDIRSDGSADGSGLVWGRDVVVTGENLSLLFGDIAYLSVKTETCWLAGAADPLPKGSRPTDPNRLVIPWRVLADSIAQAKAEGRLDPDDPKPVHATVELTSRGGERLVKHQHHRKAVFFASYAAAHPDARLPRFYQRHTFHHRG